MQRKSLDRMPCPIARSLERVGEWWSILILRDALHGLRRFDEFQKSLGIAPNMLTRRLNALVDAGLLERRRYSERPPRDEYARRRSGGAQVSSELGPMSRLLCCAVAPPAPAPRSLAGRTASSRSHRRLTRARRRDLPRRRGWTER